MPHGDKKEKKVKKEGSSSQASLANAASDPSVSSSSREQQPATTNSAENKSAGSNAGTGDDALVKRPAPNGINQPSSSVLANPSTSGGTEQEDPPDDPLEERRIIKDMIQTSDKNPKIGDLWYLVNLKWWKAWKLYSDYEERDDDHNAQPPGQIDNSLLLEQRAGEDRLKHGLLESVDYHLLPATAWKQLRAWYGGGPVICRKMIGVPVAIGGRLDLKHEVEVYLTVVRLYRSDAPPGMCHTSISVISLTGIV